MPTVLQFRRGTTTQNNNFTGTAGELSVDTTLDTLRIHDGSTAGGFALLKETGVSNLTLNAQAEIRLGDSNSSNYVALKSAATVSSNLVFTLPSADGSAGQALVTDASGTLSFAAAGATISADTSTNTNFLLYFASTTSGALTAVKQDSGLIYNPSTGSLTSTVFKGKATSAEYADLAEKYTTAEELPAGTAVAVGGEAEVCPATASNHCIGVVSTDPAYMMNSASDGQYIGLKGRLPVRVKGVVNKGDAVYALSDGVCTTLATTAMVGIALESSTDTAEKLVECVLKV